MRNLNTFNGLAVRPFYRNLVPLALVFIIALFSSTESRADVVDIPAPPKAAVHLPHTGMTMETVTARWGEPQTRHATVSNPGTEHQPPINRWDYEHFSVVFERDKVIHTINPQQPPAVKQPTP